MDSLRQLAARFDGAATTLTGASHRLAGLEPPSPAFGDGAPGRLGELGRVLHGQWLGAFGARAREAAATGARLSDAASALRAVAAEYSDVDEAARRRPEEA
ncbi:hypothetical protein [Phytohabitans rumicis]|uniref:Excreted virulence factor EspC, type VII ESX diderm n=1 Tax=Phytohabitans rumicis TaxID=1076125 RepID=A0A6V8LBP0_9ACTN|nr:hypothetical protein [Phytohabitans rumicis]GFJ90075.1 hypothetical protein Prum_037170 [Phytohabitans rumicis]